jgi:PPK2 family polyphosphate:nucleotide phosphotransferase
MARTEEDAMPDVLVKKLLSRYRVSDGTKFRLKDYSTGDVAPDLVNPDNSTTLLAAGVARLSELQERLYAEHSWSLLAVFQAMDAAGKDGTIKHVMSGVNPQGCQVTSFKQPSEEELDHDWMWRCCKALPERGRIGIFNRSYYEECLVVRVHPEILAKQKLPPKLVTKDIWRDRFEDISAMERYIARNGTVILKFFLNVSREEQRERFLERLEDPAKNWKFSLADIGERKLWDKYQAAYQDLIRHTSTKHAPWHIVPADHKWFARVVIGSAIVAALDKLDLHFPKVDKADRSEFKQVREALLAEEKATKK